MTRSVPTIPCLKLKWEFYPKFKVRMRLYQKLKRKASETAHLGKVPAPSLTTHYLGLMPQSRRKEPTLLSGLLISTHAHVSQQNTENIKSKWRRGWSRQNEASEMFFPPQVSFIYIKGILSLSKFLGQTQNLAFLHMEHSWGL